MTENGKQYRVKNMSNWSTLIFIVATLFSIFSSMVISILIDESVLSLVIGGAIALVLIVLLFRYLQQQLEITVGTDTIEVRYIHKPFFDSATDMHIAMDEIASYKLDGFNGIRFILYLRDGRKFKIALGRSAKTKPIEEMAEHIILQIAERQLNSNNANPLPYRRKTYLEGTSGLILAGLASVLIIVMLYSIFFIKEIHKDSDVIRGVGSIVMCVVFIYRVFSLRKNADHETE